MRETIVQRRDRELLAAIKLGHVRTWQSALLVRKEGWNTVRQSLKRLRDAGLIKTSQEYVVIEPAPPC